MMTRIITIILIKIINIMTQTIINRLMMITVIIIMIINIRVTIVVIILHIIYNIIGFFISSTLQAQQYKDVFMRVPYTTLQPRGHFFHWVWGNGLAWDSMVRDGLIAR